MAPTNLKITKVIAKAQGMIATPPEPLRRLYEEEPELGHSLLDLEPRLTRAARVTIAGLAGPPA